MLKEKSNYKYLDKLYLKDIIAKTNNLLQPSAFKNFFPSSFLNLTDIMNVLSEIINNNAKDNIRVFIEQNLSADYEARLFDSNIEKKDSLGEWAKKLFKNKKFGIIINHAHLFNEKISQNIAHFLSPLLKDIGIPSGGIGISLFIGNYGYTPFGVHQDMDEEYIFLFHLGDCNKKMFVWNPNYFQKLNLCTEDYFEPKRIEQYSKSFILERGDLLFFPAKYYHIGKTDDLSVSLSVGILGITNKQLVEAIFRHIYNEYYCFAPPTRMDLKLLKPNDESLLKHLSPRFYRENYKFETFEELTNEAYTDLYFMRLSNAGFTGKTKLQKISLKDYLDRSLQICSPYKIYYREIASNKVAIYTRGHKLVVDNHSYISTLISNVNSGKQFTIENLMAPLLEEWGKDLTYNLTKYLVECSSIKIV
jgi:hypothetical protein